MWRVPVLAVSSLVFLLGAGDGSRRQLAFPLVFHVAVDEAGTPVASPEQLDRLLEVASHHLGAAQIRFERWPDRTLPAEHASLDTIRERRALRVFAQPGAINVFVVTSILDPHPSSSTLRAARWLGQRPTGRLAGAHIEAPGLSPDTYILVDRDASPLTLTHELGHFFGAPHHRDPENIMSYGSDRRWFTPEQLDYFHQVALRRQFEVRRPGS